MSREGFVVGRMILATVVKDLNRKAEEKEQQKKDERKRRREEAVMPALAQTCSYRECSFAAQSKAGLVNHQRQKHGSQSTTSFDTIILYSNC